MEDKGHHTRGLLQTDWVDRGPDASKARRDLFDVSNGRVFCFNGTAYVTTDASDFTLKGSQSQHPGFCAVENRTFLSAACSCSSAEFFARNVPRELTSFLAAAS